MFNLFKCNHPAWALAVQKDSTYKPDMKQLPGEFTIITHHLYCQKCQEHIDISYAQPHNDVIDANIRREIELENRT